MSDRALSVLVHGPSGAGKSTFAATAPRPLLFLDVESGSRFLKGRKKRWDPSKEEPPKADGTWDICIVSVRNFSTATDAYKWLQSGKHEFKSLVLDSITELQIRVQESVAGRQQMKTQDWGELLRRMSFFCRDLRDLTDHPTNPLESVVITAMSKKDPEGVTIPLLQGSIGAQVPYWFDICAYLYTQQTANQDTQQYETRRFLLTRDHPHFLAKERVGGLLNAMIENPNVAEMLDAVFGPADEA